MGDKIADGELIGNVGDKDGVDPGWIGVKRMLDDPKLVSPSRNKVLDRLTSLFDTLLFTFRSSADGDGDISSTIL